MMEKKLAEGREYIGISQVTGPLVFVKGIHNVGYNELAEIVDSKGHVRLGMVLESSEGAAVIQVFEGTSGLSIPETRVRFRGEPLKFGVGSRDPRPRLQRPRGSRSTAGRRRWSKR